MKKEKKKGDVWFYCLLCDWLFMSVKSTFPSHQYFLYDSRHSIYFMQGLCHSKETFCEVIYYFTCKMNSPLFFSKVFLRNTFFLLHLSHVIIFYPKLYTVCWLAELLFFPLMLWNKAWKILKDGFIVLYFFCSSFFFMLT